MTNDPAAVAAVLLLGFIAGILSGMFGIGGGLVIVPAAGDPLHHAIEDGDRHVALRADVAGGPAGRDRVLEGGAHGRLAGRLGSPSACSSAAYLGAQVTLALPASTMKRGYAVFLLVVGTYFLLTTKSEPPRQGPTAPASDVLGTAKK